MTDSTLPKRGHRLWLPVTFAVLVILGITIVRALPELERNLKNWITAGMILLGAVATLIWFLLLSRFPWKVRLRGFAVAVLVLAGLSFSLRRDGTVDGTGRPRLVWRWAPKVKLPLPTANPENTTVAKAPDAKDVPDFFGPERDGIVRGANLLPDWKQHPPKELWRQPVGAAWSAFAVVGGRAYTQEQRGEDEAVTCYELLTGKLLWMHTHKARFEEWQGGPGPRATPVVRNNRVYAMGGTGILDCLDAVTGMEIWAQAVLRDAADNITWGVSASPLVFEDTVVVAGRKNGPTLVAFGASTGERLWEAGKDSPSYASPVLATLAGRRVILSFNATVFTIHDSGGGTVLAEYLWGAPAPARAAQPVVVGEDRVFLSAGYGAGCVLLKVEAAADGKLAISEVWKNLKMKNQFNSVALREGHLYGLDDNKLACMNVESGERLWKEGRFGSGQSLLVDDLVIVQSEPGDVVLCSANTSGYKELGRIPALGSKTWNHPVLAGRYLLVRNDQEAVCYELPVRQPGN